MTTDSIGWILLGLSFAGIVLGNFAVKRLDASAKERLTARLLRITIVNIVAVVGCLLLARQLPVAGWFALAAVGALSFAFLARGLVSLDMPQTQRRLILAGNTLLYGGLLGFAIRQGYRAL